MDAIDTDARTALADAIEDALAGSPHDAPPPDTPDRAVRVVYERLFGRRRSTEPSDDVWSAPLRRDAERACLLLRTDVPGPPPLWFERIPGAFPIGWLFAGAALAVGAKTLDAPSPVVHFGLAVFAAGGLTLIGGSLWILWLLATSGEIDPDEERPDECWPFPDRATYESVRDAGSRA